MFRGAVIGNPVEHSLSPEVYALFDQEFNVGLKYEKILATDSNQFKKIVTDFFNNGGCVLTITSPFKQDAFKIADIATMRSQISGAANFLRLNENKQIVADTTDGIGLLKDIQTHKNFSLANKNILMIGSGFVLDSILLDLIVAAPLSIDILARNQERIKYLQDKFQCGRFNPDKDYDFILNIVPNKSENLLLKTLTKINNGTVCYDMAYTDLENNKFFQYIKSINNKVKLYSGMGMLVEQALIVFSTLFNLKPNTARVITELDNKIKRI